MRYLPLTDADRRDMLAAIGAGSVDALFRDVPPDAYHREPLADLPPKSPEFAVERALGAMAQRNLSAGVAPCFLGAGAYRHHVPASVDHLIQRGEFLTSYTPYQPEVSQGTLQYLFEFQTQVALLTGMDVANASLYDGATATSEAVMMANRVTRRTRAILSGGLHPHYRDTTRTQARYNGFELVEPEPDPTGREDLASLIDEKTSCVVVQTPTLFGHPLDLTALAEAAHAKGALLVAVTTEAISLGLLTPPGEMGADIVAAEGQSIGNALNFGGPHIGLFATRDRFVRQMPGRLCGQTVDAEDRRGFVLTLSTREQHIRREKATSNICTNSGLCALAFTIHMTLLGEEGLKRVALLNHEAAQKTAERLARVQGVKVLNDAFFNEFTVKLPKPAAGIVDAMAERGVLGGVPVSRLYKNRPALFDLMLVAATELNTDDEIERLGSALEEVLR